ncbi:hypothetical protein BN946_scf184461.g4 [Trametes cinnabarina]|uniref:Reverse transcriptase domain-containing protein n=1 Tax=Pycnoporus cinnabarinus TaxID=5643 RepID=A0A060SK67_PYCCI|nr:hypothetical protein BN946_scf184461.g4 [Trametes cinnabarina]
MPPAVAKAAAATRSTARTAAPARPSSSSQPSGTPPPSQPSGKPYVPPAPQAKTALQGIRELAGVINAFSVGQLNALRKKEIQSFVSHIETLIVLETATARPVDSGPGLVPAPDLATPAASAPLDLSPLVSSITATHQSVDALRGELQQLVKTAVADALSSPAVSAKLSAPAPAPPSPPRDSPKHLEVTIGTPPEARTGVLAKLSPAQLKNEVDAALDKSGVPGLVGTRVHGVRRLHTGSLLVHASSPEQADLLLQQDEVWLPHLDSLRGAKVERKSYMLIAAAVPTEFEPSAASAAESLWLENAGTVASKSSISGLRWLHAERGMSPAKKAGSLVFSVASQVEADQLIYHSITVRGALCAVSNRHCTHIKHGSRALSDTLASGMRVFNLNCRRSPEVVLSVLNSMDPSRWDVLCLQEPPIHIADRAGFRSPHWNLLLPGTPGQRDSPAPRSVIYVSNRLPSDSYTQIPLTTYDICAIHFSFSSFSFSLFSIYNPPGSVSSVTMLRTILSDPALPPSPRLLCGDFNLHHPLWSGTDSPERTRRSDADTLLQVLADHQLSLALPPGTPTFRSDAHGTWATLDLVFVSGAAEDLVVRCEPGTGHGSDHRSLEIELDLSVPLLSPPSRLNWRETDWGRYKEEVATRWESQRILERSLRLPTRQSIDALVSDITDILSQAAQDSIPHAKPCPYSKHWWTSELTAMKCEASRLANRAAKRHASEADTEAARHAHWVYHRAIRRQKRQHWREYVEAATERTIWQASKYVTQAPENTLASRLPALTLPDGSVARSCHEKRDALMSQFFPVPPPASLDDINDTVHGEQLPLTPFTEEDVAAAVNDLHPFKAPGPSGVPNAALKQCAELIVPVFTNLINSSILRGYHPNLWKFFTTITLRKPGKPSYLIPKAYRPIALEDTSSKVMESVVARKLAALAEEHHLLPPNHFGGRPQRTTTDAILHLVQHIKDAWRKGLVTTVLFLDISSAFPSVNHQRLLHNLRKRRVPEPLVRWIADFLRDRCTQLKFDDFTSEPLPADCGLPQGSPLSPILYLFYSSDLLEICDPRDRSRTSLGYIDDTAMVVSSKSIADNIRALSVLSPQLLHWSTRHVCRFDIAKFQLLHCTRYEPRYTPLPLTIGTHTVSPSDAALYLGVMVDRKLRWREHVELAVAKGTAATLAIGRLARPSFSLPHQYVRQLFQAVVCPKMEYALVVWFTPISRQPGSRRASGSVGIARQIAKVQRLATLLVTGAFRSTSTSFLDYHAGLLPTELRLNHAAYKAAARIAALPEDHLLHPAIRRCATRYPRYHRSPLHELFHAFPELRNVTPLCTASPLALEDWPFEVRLEGSREDACVAADEALASHDICVSVQRQVSGRCIGIAAVAATRDGGTVARQAYLEPASQRQPFDGSLAALTLAVSAIRGCPRATRASILVPDRAAVHLLLSQPDLPLCRLFLDQVHALRRARCSLRLRVIWAPSSSSSHTMVTAARSLAKRAAEARVAPSPELHKSITRTFSSLPTSRAVLIRQHLTTLLDTWAAQWRDSPQGNRCATVIDDVPPSLTVHKLYRGLNRRQCSVLTQLRSGHIALNAYLACIRAVDSPLCSHCGIPETVSHFMFTCRRYTLQRHRLRQAVNGPLSLRSTLGSTDARQAVLETPGKQAPSSSTPAIPASIESPESPGSINAIEHDAPMPATAYQIVYPPQHGVLALKAQHLDIQDVVSATRRWLERDIVTLDVFPDARDRGCLVHMAMVETVKTLKPADRYAALVTCMITDSNFTRALSAIPNQQISTFHGKVKEKSNIAVTAAYGLVSGDAKERVEWLLSELIYIYPTDLEKKTITENKPYQHPVIVFYPARDILQRPASICE